MPRTTIFVDQFDFGPIDEVPDPNHPYWVLEDQQETNLSLLMKFILLARKHDVMARIEELCTDPKQINHQTTNGFTPLHLAAIFAGSFSTDAIVKLLLDRGAAITPIPGSSICFLSNIIINAHMGYSSHATVELLVTKHSPLNLSIPLHTAASFRDPISVIMLLRAGAYIDSRDTFKATPLMRACEENNLEVAELLISRGANLKAVQINGYTALGIAAFKGHTKIVRLLINSKADIYLVSLRGQHPTQSPQVKDKIKRLFDHALLARRLKYQSSLFLHLNYDTFVAQRTSTPRRVYHRIS